MEVPNLQAVGVQADKVVVQCPLQVMSKHEALCLAAWLVAITDEEKAFKDYLKAVRV